MSELTDPSPEELEARLEREEVDLLATMDGEVWAREFSRIAAKAVSADEVLDPVPGGFLHSWFANALETGRAHGTEIPEGPPLLLYGELELSAEQVTRLFKNLTVQSCQASLDGAIQWDFAGGVIVRFAVAPDGTGFFRGLIAP